MFQGEAMPEESSKGFVAFVKRNWKDIVILCTCVCVVLGAVIGIWSFYLEHLTPKRADLKIVLDPYDAIWESNSDHSTFSVNGSLCNDGSSTAKVVQYSLSLVYILPSGDRHVLTQEFTNISRTWNVSNPPIREKDTVNFYLAVHIWEVFTIDGTTGQVIPIRTSPPDEIKIAVIYDDGLGSQTSERTFSYQKP
jgi:hypothetical protein